MQILDISIKIFDFSTYVCVCVCGDYGSYSKVNKSE